jgi:hypothetical protein
MSAMSKLKIPDHLAHHLNELGEVLHIAQEDGEPISAFAARLIEEIDLTIPQMLEARSWLTIVASYDDRN